MFGRVSSAIYGRKVDEVWGKERSGAYERKALAQSCPIAMMFLHLVMTSLLEPKPQVRLG